MKIPEYIENLIEKLEQAGYGAYIVGGCVRDLLLGKAPKDWDITTNARPEEILKVFPEGKYENVFGTVLVPVERGTENRKREAEKLNILTKALDVDKKDKERAIKIAKDYFKKIKCPAHGIKHAENVVGYVAKIAKKYKNINSDILEIAAYFHDAGRVKYDDSRHIEESQKIAEKELMNIFNKDIVNCVKKIVYHNLDSPADSLEQQIIKEADLLDGVDVERLKVAKEINLVGHAEWIKNNFVNNKYYNLFITEEGVKLLKENIKKFNQADFDFMLPDFTEKKGIVEVTTYRSEQGYSDRRHPDEIRFEDSLDKDLERRDFTINAMAMKRATRNAQLATQKKIKSYELRDVSYEIIDLFGGEKDIKKRIIRAVGEPIDRFKEDSLRMMRAIRFSCRLGFAIEPKTERAIKKMAGGIKFVSQERIRDELVKILESDKAYEGIMLLRDTKLLQYILPELERGIGVDQNHHHVYTVFKHSVLSLKYCPSKDWRVRFASLLHDIAKPQTKKLIKGGYTFYNHDIVGAKVAKKIMSRLKFSNDDTQKVVSLVKNHMFYYNVDEVTASSVRRLIVKVGKDNLKDLIDIRIADRLGSGVPKAKPYKLRHLEYMMERVQKDPISAKMLKINGDDLIKLLKIKPSPKIGAILDVLLSDVIEDPKLNDKKYLESRSQELNKMDLAALRDKAKEKIEEKKMEDDRELKEEFWVK